MSTEFHARGVKCATRYLEAVGYRVVETGWSSSCGGVDVIAVSGDGTLCFIDVDARRVGGAPSAGRGGRRHHELVAMSYLPELPDDFPDGELRFDRIGISVAENGKAFLIHSANDFDGE